MTVGIKYCGGCNPRYDRAAAVRRLHAALPGAAFVNAVPGQRYDALLVVCGCSARCAGLHGLESSRVVLLCREQDIAPAAKELTTLQRSGQDGLENLL